MIYGSFSRTVFAGLLMRGFGEARIGGMVGWTGAEVREGMAGKRALSDAMLDVIEQETGYSAGQLAALSVEPEGGAFTEICDELATVKRPAGGGRGRKAG